MATLLVLPPASVVGDQVHVLCCRGHGTQVVDGTLIATVCGVIQRVNKLISVVPVKNRCI